MKRTSNKLLELASLALLPIVLCACAYFDIGSSGLLIFVASVLSLGVFFAGWENSRPSARQVIVIAVMSAIAAVGRVVFAPIPSVQPVTAICIISGACFGRRDGFMTGAIAAFVSNCFLGQGMWTPWQMYAWGLIGYLSGVLFHLRKNPEPSATIAICAFGFLSSYLFSAIMNTWAIIGFYRDIGIVSISSIYAAALLLDTAHAISTVLFLSVLYVPWRKKLLRIMQKYTLGA